MSASTIALIECDKTGDAALPERLRRLGYFLLSFKSPCEFIAAAREGATFDLLLSPLQPAVQWRDLLAVCASATLPVILLASDRQMPDLAHALVVAQEQFNGRADVHFATLPITDMELGWWVGLLSRPWPDDLLLIERQSDRFYGPYRMNLARRRVYLRNRDANLAPREFEVLRFLFDNMNQVLDRDVLLKAIWGSEAGSHKSRVLDTCISNLRRKLSLCERNGFELIPVYRRGYELRQIDFSGARGATPDPVRSLEDEPLQQNCELATL